MTTTTYAVDIMLSATGTDTDIIDKFDSFFTSKLKESLTSLIIAVEDDDTGETKFKGGLDLCLEKELLSFVQVDNPTAKTIRTFQPADSTSTPPYGWSDYGDGIHGGTSVVQWAVDSTSVRVPWTIGGSTKTYVRADVSYQNLGTGSSA